MPSRTRSPPAEPPTGFPTFASFWPFYLHEHSLPLTRALHLAGTTLSLLLATSAAILRAPGLLCGVPVVGYALAWTGHFFVERNRPATFRYPGWSLWADFRMWGLWVSGGLEGELVRCGVKGAREGEEVKVE